MVNLIGNEIKKVFSKWSVKILIIIAILLMLLQAIVEVKYAEEDYYEEIYITETEGYIGEIEKDNETLLNDAKKELSSNEKLLIDYIFTNDMTDLRELQTENALLELEIEVLELRINKNIEYGSYMDKALDNYSNNMRYVLSNELYVESESEKRELDEIRAEAMIAKHVIDTGKDLYNINNASYSYKEYMLAIGELMLILVIITVAGSIVSEEFNKGTIKQLLIRPYTRTKIWFSKYFASIIITIIVALIIGVIAAIVFGIFMGFDDFGVYNIGVYDYNSGSAYCMNVFAYIGTIFISKIPLLIMLGTMAIFVSTILNNTAMAVAVPLLGTIAASIVSPLLMYYEKFRFLKYFITPHWDWSVYNFGKKSIFEFIDFRFSIIVYMIWLIALIGLAIFRFKKEDIKNI